jgi:uncharacterized membrane protein YphA (DoxX/SURF4 family)
METLLKAARISYGILIAGLGIQQIMYGAFRPVILPPWPTSTGLATCAYIAGALLIVAGGAIILDKQTRTVSLFLGGILLLLFALCQIPYELIADPNYKNLGVWTSAFKELALSGSAFIIAGSFPGSSHHQKKSFIISLLEKMIPLGGVFFSVMMVVFGIDHFLYTAWIGTLVPNWIPGHIFWAYFAGVALIGSGLAIITKVQLKLSAILLGIMLFLWFILLHIPRAIVDPVSLQGNEVSSVLESFGFSGIAILIAYRYQTKNADIQLQREALT